MNHFFTLILFSLLWLTLACNRSGDTFDGKNGVKLSYFKHTHDVKARVEYKNGYADGLYESYYPSGKVKSKLYYWKGMRHGASTQYYENGQVKQTEFFKEDQSDSTFRLYNQEGKPLTEKNYQEGKLEGRLVEYFSDGKPRIQQHYVHGQLDGEQKAYYPNGKLKEVAFYSEGFPGAGTKEYAADGTLKESGISILMEEINQLALQSKYIYRFRLSQSTPHDQIFFTDQLREGRYTHPSMYPLPRKGGYFEHELFVPKGGNLMQSIIVVAKTKTKSGRDLVLTKRVNVGLNNFY